MGGSVIARRTGDDADDEAAVAFSTSEAKSVIIISGGEPSSVVPCKYIVESSPSDRWAFSFDDDIESDV